MKIFIGVIIFFSLVFPVFSQSTDAERFRVLSETMESSISKSSDILTNFDVRSADDGSIRTYSFYRRKHEELLAALKDSEIKLEHFFRTNDRVDYIRKERDNYERLLRDLETLKSEYDSWLRTVQ